MDKEAENLQAAGSRICLMESSALSDKSDMRQGRLVALVIAGTMIFWVVAQWMGAAIGLPNRYVFLVDFFALAGFLWALIVTWQIWRKRRDRNK